MNTKNFIIAGIAGAIVDFLLGGLFYQVIFPDIYPSSETTNISFIALGCLFFGLFISYIFLRWANISTLTTGLTAGAVIGLLYGVSMNFFMYSNMAFNMGSFIKDAIVNIVISACVGGVVGLINGKLK